MVKSERIVILPVILAFNAIINQIQGLDQKSKPCFKIFRINFLDEKHK